MTIIKNKKMKQGCFNCLFKILLFSLIVFNSNIAISQNNTRSLIDKTIDSVNKIYGYSDILVNGPLYFQENRLAKGSPFYENDNFIDGTIYARGTEFSNVRINYNVSLQKLLMLITTSEGSNMSIVLSEDVIDSFIFSNDVFVVPMKLGLVASFPYLQKVNSGNYTMFLGLKKDFVNRYTERNPYGMYSKIKQTMFVEVDGEMIRISSKKSFLGLWPSQDKEIAVFMRKNKIKLNKASTDKLKILMNFINEKVNDDN